MPGAGNRGGRAGGAPASSLGGRIRAAVGRVAQGARNLAGRLFRRR